MTPTPLSTRLSQLLVAFTIELDNEFERRFAEASGSARVTSVVMWSNFLRFVGDGITVEELPGATGLPKTRVLSTLGGMERWRYVSVGATGTTKRNGYGSAGGLRNEWLVRPTSSGEKAREIWPPLFDEIGTRWERRFGANAFVELRSALEALAERIEVALPEYLPIVVGATGMVAEIPEAERRDPPPGDLLGLLAQVLLAYALDFERESEVSLPLTANVLRVLDGAESDVRELPAAAGVAPEGIAMALTFLKKHGYVVQDAKEVQVTTTGRQARDAAPKHHESVLRGWGARFGCDRIDRLRTAVEPFLDGIKLAEGMEPYPQGWRAGGKYLRRTEAMLDDPLTGLPHYPMVLHRGGWPDGS